MKLKISALLLVLCMVFGSCVPHKNIAAYGQELYEPSTSVELELAEIEPNNDDDTAAVIVAVIVVVLVICIVIYCCDSEK